tara:strand:- start:237 stop:563 length:327 start_codon:yes stop_codon:yes gene_type:complete
MNAFYKELQDKLIRDMETKIKEQEQEIRDLKEEQESGDYFDKDIAVDMSEMFSSRENYEFVDSEDYGYDGTETYEDKRTGKLWMIEWTRVRHYDKAVEIDRETGEVIK